MRGTVRRHSGPDHDILLQIFAILALCFVALTIAGCGSAGASGTNSNSGSGSGSSGVPAVSLSSSSLAFGNVSVGGSSSQNITISNSGTANLVVSSLTLAGAGFSSSGATFPLTVAPGNTSTVTVVFAPQSSGASTGTATFVSNDAGSPDAVALSGTGVAAVAHNVALTWTASTSTVVGYNVYRSNQTGGPYQLLTSSLQTGTSFTDSAVSAGSAYFYVVTAVDSNNVESVPSNESQAVVPTP